MVRAYKYSQEFPKGITGLHLVAYFGIEPAVRLLLEKGANVNAADRRGRTPLLRASRNGHIDIVKLLLEKGCDEEGAEDDLPHGL
jgi:ankyrin repeat protein